MLCAYPAVLFETALKLLSRTMDPHVKIVPANTEACSHAVRRFFIQIEPSNQTGILRCHPRQQSLNAGADNTLFLGIRWRIDLMLKFCQGSLARIPASIEINDGPSQNPVEPSLGTFLVANLIDRLHRFEQAFLNCIGREFRIA